MVPPAIQEQILNDLKRLSPKQQERAAKLVHGLVSPLPKGASVEDLMKVAGTLDAESAREMMAAIEEGCERLVELCPVSPQNLETAGHYGDLKARLQKLGRPIPENDIWIAASALQYGLILATRDRHFESDRGPPGRILVGLTVLS